MKWSDFQNSADANAFFREIGTAIRSGQRDLGRPHYALSLAVACLEAIYCGYDRLAAIEFGVASGRGLLDLCKAAGHFRDFLELDISVIGMDNASGLPEPRDYRDHPELWVRGQFRMSDHAALRAQLPSFAKLVVGDIGDTVHEIGNILSGARLGFAAIDVDHYFSTKACLQALTLGPAHYLPAVAIYFDDLLPDRLTTNNWCGEALAITEFNSDNAFRKIQEKPSYRIARFYVCHVMDHPIRSGQQRLRPGFQFLSFIPI